MTEEDFPVIGPWRDWRPGYRGAVVIPHDASGRVLLQLRDHNPGIVHPGEWGLFGGGAEGEEALDAAAAREFEEETGVARPPAAFRPLARLVSPDVRSRLYAFTLPVDFGPEAVRLREGAGFAFIRPEEFADLRLLAASRLFLAAWRRRGGYNH